MKNLMQSNVSELTKSEVIDIFKGEYEKVFYEPLKEKVERVFVKCNDTFFRNKPIGIGKDFKKARETIVVYELVLKGFQKWILRFEKDIFLDKITPNSLEIRIDLIH